MTSKIEEYFKSRWEHFKECWKNAQRLWIAEGLAGLLAIYSALTTYGPLINLLAWAKIDSWPKIPITWALVIVLASVLLAVIEGSYRLSHQVSNIRAAIQQVRVVHSLASRLLTPLLKEIGEMKGRSFEERPVDIYVQLYVTNRLINAPTAIRDYQLLVTKGEKILRADRFPHVAGVELEFDVEIVDGYGFRQMERRHINLELDLAAEINKVPIEYGMPKVGWLHFACAGIEPEDVTLESITLTVVDAFDNRHPATIEPGALIEAEEQGM